MCGDSFVSNASHNLGTAPVIQPFALYQLFSYSQASLNYHPSLASYLRSYLHTYLVRHNCLGWTRKNYLMSVNRQIKKPRLLFYILRSYACKHIPKYLCWRLSCSMLRVVSFAFLPACRQTQLLHASLHECGGDLPFAGPV